MSYSDLTLQQKYGFAYQAKLKRAAGQAGVTGEDIAQAVMAAEGSRLYADLIARKARDFQAAFLAAPTGQQEATLAEYEVEDILTPEDLQLEGLD